MSSNEVTEMVQEIRELKAALKEAQEVARGANKGKEFYRDKWKEALHLLGQYKAAAGK